MEVVFVPPPAEKHSSSAGGGEEIHASLQLLPRHNCALEGAREMLSSSPHWLSSIAMVGWKEMHASLQPLPRRNCALEGVGGRLEPIVCGSIISYENACFDRQAFWITNMLLKQIMLVNQA